MVHVDARALFVHPTFAVIRIAGEVLGILLSRQRGFVLSHVRPELVPASEENEHRGSVSPSSCERYIIKKGEVDMENAPSAIVEAFAPFVHRDRRWANQILVIKSYTCGHEDALTTRRF